MNTASTVARSTAEIDARADELAQQKGLPFELGVLVAYLPYEEAREYLEDGVTKGDWDATRDRTPTREVVLTDMREYMGFAWDKALNHRGLSAMRSVEKMKAWLWLLGDHHGADELLRYALEDGHYKQYGAPILYRISQNFGFPIPDGQEARNMAGGRPCVEGCGEGCA